MSILGSLINSFKSSQSNVFERDNAIDSRKAQKTPLEKNPAIVKPLVEQGNNTLQDDVVTLSNRAFGQNQDTGNSYFSNQRHKALKAFMQNSSVAFGQTQKDTTQATTSNNVSMPGINIKTSPREDIVDVEFSVVDDPLNKDDDKDSVVKKSQADKAHEKEQKEAQEKHNDKKGNGEYLTDEEQDKVNQLKARDTEVKTHEKAHQAAGGQYASAPQYEYTKGPDGNSYVENGHVNIDVGKENTPEKTISKMQTVIKAAHAPAEPSGQDLKVAAQAQEQLNQAQKELTEKKQKETMEKMNKGDDKSSMSDPKSKVQNSDSSNSNNSTNAAPRMVSETTKGEVSDINVGSKTFSN